VSGSECQWEHVETVEKVTFCVWEGNRPGTRLAAHTAFARWEKAGRLDGERLRIDLASPLEDR
jgi:hypothetical protein